MSAYRLWVNEASTLLVRQWETGQVEICERDNPRAIWGPPIETRKLPSWIDNLREQVSE